MGDVADSGIAHHGIIRYVVADKTSKPEDRSLFGIAPNVSYAEHELPVRDFRAAEELVKGPEGLDVQGFTYVEHESALSGSEAWFEGRNLEDVYLPEVCHLVQNVTGASRAMVISAAFRRKTADQQKDPKWVPLKGSETDIRLSKLPRDVPSVAGKTVESSLEPIRVAHVDYSLEGLRRNIRYVRKDIAEMGRAAVEAEDAAKAGKDVRVPRYAAYSVWRPTKPVKRDGLAVLDWRSLEPDALDPFEYRGRSNVTESGEFIVQGYNVLPPKDPKKHRWYCMPHQKPNQVAIIKFADTEAEKNPDVAGCCGHCAPDVKGLENEEPRSSIECRVIAVWD